MIKTKKILIFSCMLLFSGGVGFAGLYWYFVATLPDVDSLSNYKPPIVTTVYAGNGSKIAEYFRERRYVVPLSEIPKHLQHAVIATEDARFYDHPGVDVFSIIRALFKNIRAGEIVEGASTITQQVAKSFFLTPERSYRRKIREAMLAYRIDRKFKKHEILFLYLNQIYFGHGAYGVQAAAKTYFNKPASALSLAQCAVLAGLPRAPNRYSPRRNPKLTRIRQTHVLGRMLAEGYIGKDQYRHALEEKISVAAPRPALNTIAPYYSEHVRRYVQEKYGSAALYEEGLKIYTALDLDLQQAAERAIEEGLMRVDRRHGFQGPLEHWGQAKMAEYRQSVELLPKGPVIVGGTYKGVIARVDRNGGLKVLFGRETGWVDTAGRQWTEGSGWTPKAGDVVFVRVEKPLEKEHRKGWALSIEPRATSEAALLCIEAGTGRVKAMVGGRSFRESQFNRALQAKRQAGSAFKPIVYAAAIASGYTPATTILDAPVIFYDNAGEAAWKPHNYSQRFYGPISLRKALAESINTATVKLARQIGLGDIISYARTLGISSSLNRDLSVALGSSSLTLMELSTAYSVFANQGKRISPTFITRVEDRTGRILEQNRTVSKRAIDPATAYLMTSLLRGAVENGTGRRAAALERPVAGKTGTTDDWRDAWFIGYTPKYITGVWVGRDDNTSLGRGETGSKAAIPIWLRFMQAAHENQPKGVFDPPQDIVFVKIDTETGLLPGPDTEKTRFECFIEGTEPEKHSQTMEGKSLFKNGTFAGGLSG